jgi:hypothetical protein
MKLYKEEPEKTAERIALRPREAAKMLGVSEKKLWLMTMPRGNVPCVRVGSRVLYFRHQLERWADEELTRQTHEID